MKKLNLLSKSEMKKVLGGNELPGSGNGTCHYHCCTDQHTDCSPYTTNGRSCSTSSQCADPNGSGCETGHMYWKCM